MWDLMKYENRIAVVEQDAAYTYRQLYAFCQEWYSHIGKRTLIACFCKNRMESFVAYIGSLNHKIVPIMIDSGLAPELYRSLIEQYCPEYIWIEETKRSEFGEYEQVWSWKSYVLLYKPNSDIKLYEELALLLTTSGSTGSPKLVRQSYKNILANTKSIIEYLHIEEDDVTITTLPMHYTYGISIINTYIYSGAKIVLTENSVLESDFWKLYEREGITSLSGVPFTYELLKKIRFLREAPRCLKVFTQAGGKLSEKLQEEFAEYSEKNGIKFFIMYGQTEATARMAYLPPHNILKKRGSMGIAIPNGTLWLMDENGNKIETSDTVGELVYEGENVTLGYAESREELALGDMRNGLLHTGDMAKMDEDGYFYITGRKKRFVKIYGSRVSLDECEQMIERKFNVECACVGKDNDLRVLVTKGEIAEEVAAFILDQLKISKNAFSVQVIPEILRNSAGKKLYEKMC